MLMTTAGRIFWISAPTEGSKSTSQISPRLGAGAVAIQIVLGKGFKGRQFRIVPVVVLCAGGGGLKSGVLLFPRQAAQFGGSPSFPGCRLLFTRHWNLSQMQKVARLTYVKAYLWARPIQVLFQKRKCSSAVNLVPASEEFDFRPLRYLQFGVQPAHLGVLIRHPFIKADAVIMAALDHEWPGRDERRHFGVAEGVVHVEVEDFVGVHEQVAGGEVECRRLPREVVEIGGADRQGVATD